MQWVVFVIACELLFCFAAFGQSFKPQELKMDPLPQALAGSRIGSDLIDEGLKGKIKMVVVENADVTTQQSKVGPRRISHLMLFNSRGDFLQRDYYDSNGRPYSIRQYGYIDGKRVSKGRSITYEDDPPAPAPRPSSGVSPTRDIRFDYLYESNYTNGKLTEMILISNRGEKLTRTVYSHSVDQIEKLVYSPDQLNQKYLMKLDAKGNVIEEINFGLQNRDIYGDRTYRYTYEFDKQGNWIRREASRETVENGILVFKPAHVQFRTISYF
jgi:hypothetical protein